MRVPSYSSQFHRDVKRLQKQRKDLEKLKALIELLSRAAVAATL